MQIPLITIIITNKQNKEFTGNLITISAYFEQTEYAIKTKLRLPFLQFVVVAV